MGSPAKQRKRLSNWIPAFGWGFQLNAEQLRSDMLAGATTAVLLVPQGMGYASLAGLPPVVGLYAALVPILVYALLGTSRVLSVGPAALDSLLVAVTVGAVAQGGSDAYLTYAAVLAAMVGIIHVGLGLLGLGFVVNFLSRPVLIGFTSAAAVLIACSQLPLMLGVGAPQGQTVITRALSASRMVEAWQWPTLVIGIVACLLLFGLRRWKASFPRAMAVMALAIGVVYVLDLQAQGVAIVGAVPSGLPGLSLPIIDWDVLVALTPGAVTLALVSFVQVISVGKHFAEKGKYEVRPGQELVAIGVANVASSLFGGYSVSGSISRSAVNEQAGAKTPLAGVFTAALVALTLLFLTPLFFYLPIAVLAAIIMVAVFGLIDLKEPLRLWKVKRVDFWVLLLTFCVTLAVGIQFGILVGVAVSIVAFLVRTSRPHVAVLGEVDGKGGYLNVKRFPHAVTHPGVLILRVDARIYFGNVTFLKQTLRGLEAEMPAPLKFLILDASGINQLDSSAESALRQLDESYKDRGVSVLWAHVKGPVRDVMECTGVLQMLKREKRFFLKTHDAVVWATQVLGIPLEQTRLSQQASESGSADATAAEPVPYWH